MGERVTSVANPAYQPHVDPGVNVISGPLSPIPEDTPALHLRHNGLDLGGQNRADRRQLVTSFSQMDIENHPFPSRGFYENSSLHNPSYEYEPQRIPRATSSLADTSSARNITKREGTERNHPPTRRSFKSSAGQTGYRQTLELDSPSQSSEGYGSSSNLAEAEQRRAAVPNYRPDNEDESADSPTDSESTEWRGSSGRNIDRRNRQALSSRLLRRPEIMINRTSPETVPPSQMPATELQSFQNNPGQRLDAKLSSEAVGREVAQRGRRKGQTGGSRSPRHVESSLNSLHVPSYGTTQGSGSERGGFGSPRSSRRSEVTVTVSRSEVGRSSRTSKQQSVFQLGGSAVSAQMVSSNPSAAADVAFASLELPSGLLPTSSKQLRQICKPMMTCLLLMTLAASLCAAVYFAVVLNKTQAEHIEFLRARLNFYLNQTSSDSLTSMSTSERTRFEEKYCQEINAYYQTSELSRTYRGCEVASLQQEKLSVLLYFDNPTSPRESNSHNVTGDAILKVLASSAPRNTQQESDVISVNNVPVQLSKVDIIVEQTKQRPRFSVQHFQNGQSSSSDSTDSKPAGTKSSKEQNRPTISPNTPDSPSIQKDPFHPCASGESETYYRYPGSCTIFFQCLHGRSIALMCGNHLVFDLDRKVCVQEAADCNEDSAQAEFFADVPPEDLQPCEYKGGSFYPHPRVCNLYFQCTTTGAPTVGICPHGLVFNQHLHTCAMLDSTSACPEAPANQRPENLQSTSEHEKKANQNSENSHSAPGQAEMTNENAENSHSTAEQANTANDSASDCKTANHNPEISHSMSEHADTANQTTDDFHSVSEQGEKELEPRTNDSDVETSHIKHANVVNLSNTTSNLKDADSSDPAEDRDSSDQTESMNMTEANTVDESNDLSKTTHKNSVETITNVLRNVDSVGTTPDANVNEKVTTMEHTEQANSIG